MPQSEKISVGIPDQRQGVAPVLVYLNFSFFTRKTLLTSVWKNVFLACRNQSFVAKFDEQCLISYVNVSSAMLFRFEIRAAGLVPSCPFVRLVNRIVNSSWTKAQQMHSSTNEATTTPWGHIMTSLAMCRTMCNRWKCIECGAGPNHPRLLKIVGLRYRKKNGFGGCVPRGIPVS